MKKMIIKEIFFLALILSPKISLAQNLPIVINQVLIGQNEGIKNEFIELYNPNNFPLNLESYSLKKKTTSGSESNLVSNKKFIGTIPALGYFLISSPEFFSQIKADLVYSTSNSLSPDNSLLLYNQDSILIDKLGFGKANDFYKKPTNNPENNDIIKRINFKKDNQNNFEDFKIIKDETKVRNSQNEIITIKNIGENTVKNKTTIEKNIIKIRIGEIKNLENNTQIEVEGIAANLPGELGSQYFYILEESEEQKEYLPGIQIYNYYKKFPNLKIGDKIKVSGEFNITESNYRIKTKNLEDITVLSSNNILGEIETTKISFLKNIPVGSLVKISGKIVQNKTNAIYLDDDTGEILINIKKGTNIDNKSLQEKNYYTITGILNINKENLEIIPLSDKFISPSEQSMKNKMPGEIIQDNPLVIESRKKEKQKIIIKYFIFIFITSLFCFFYGNKIKFI